MAKQWTVVLGLALVAIPAVAQDTPTFKSPKEKFSYALGMEIGNGFRKQSLELDPESVGKGLADAFSGGKTLLTEDEMRAVLTSAQEEYKKKQAELRAEKAQTALKEGEAFLAANKSKEGVITLPSGLQYKILEAGKGEKPELDETVVCTYRGTLLDGTEFDSSAKHNGPATFPLKGVIKGWTEALQLMPVGSKWQLFVPPQLAYGQNGSGQIIPPNSTLVFEVELLAIKEKDKDAPERERE
ncbi:MAG TPA: FKBP-type peptidyl-prolyl cis-trans isomerase [Terriglobales bacterium]|nr:FKBP-type peptidyl-prolyl cis-trans isomerase [Terriglobales bacterium]